MSRRVVATGYGGPENLSLETHDPARPGAEDVLIEVRAAAVNAIDLKIYSGVFGRDPARLPVPLGFEVAGTVAEAGAGTSFSVGDEVIGYRVDGGYAEHVLTGADRVLPKPAALDWAQAAGLLLAGVTAAHGLTATGVGPGDTVLLHAAAGGVGQAAVQLAVARGARVIGTAGEGNHDLLRRLGAEPVTYGPGLEERVRELAPDGVDAAFDMVGGDEPLDVSLALLHDRARFATIVATPRVGELGLKRLGGGPGADPGEEIRSAARFDLLSAAAAGELAVTVAATFPLEQVADAHRLVATGHAAGKVVLTV